MKTLSHVRGWVNAAPYRTDDDDDVVGMSETEEIPWPSWLVCCFETENRPERLDDCLGTRSSITLWSCI